MKWYKSLFSKAPEISDTPNTSEAGYAPLPASGELVYLEPTILRERKWVMYGDKVGIVVDLSGAGFAVVHFINELGETLYANRVPVGQLTLAKHLDIPESRRHPDAASAAALGYL